jgi:ParB family transcriptional regulator, chromosome partitioning protein
MEAASAVRKIPLNKLVLSPTNARKTPPSAAEDAELKASLKTRGLKQNLVVHPSAEEKSVHAVTAGGRRLKALQELAAEGLIPADYRVPCLVEEPEQALETSLMENKIRAAMHPADEFVAMADLIDAGQPIEAVATRFGVSEKYVKQRLRLGKVAPELLDEFRTGAITLEVMMALTLAVDHHSQLAAWRQVKNQPYAAAHAVRRLLTQGAVSVHSRLGAFVAITAYEAAGGTVRCDLFSTRNEGFMDDAALVRRLAIEKLEAKAEELRSSWAWARAVLDPDYGFAADYARVYPKPPDLPPEIAEEIERIEQRMAELDDIAEHDWTEELAAEAERLEERHAELTEGADEEAVYADEDRAVAGCIVTVGDDGDFCLYQGLVERAAARGERDAGASETAGHAGEPPISTTSEEEERSSGASRTGEQMVRKECGFSQVLVEDLKAHRLQITKAHLAADFELAFDLALYSLCIDVLHLGYRSRPLDLKAIETRRRSSLNDLAGTPADRLLEVHRKALDTDWLSLSPCKGFDALSALAPEAKHRLFAWCIAAALNGQLAVEDQANPVLERAGQRLAIPVTEYWRPTAANYWGRVKKSHGLAVANAILGARWARDHADQKKPALAAALEQAFDPAANSACIALDQSTRDAAAAWAAPGLAYVDGIGDDDVEPEIDAGAQTDRDSGDDIPPDADVAASDLPAFLADNGPDHVGRNEASVT